MGRLSPTVVGKRLHAAPAGRLPDVQTARETPDIQLQKCRTCQHWLTALDLRRNGIRFCATCGDVNVATPAAGRKDRVD